MNKRVCALLLTTLVSPSALAEQPARFSSAAVGATQPRGWSVQPIPGVARQTRFDLIESGGTTVLRARADNAAASLRAAVDVDPASTGQLAWRWKTERVLAKADLTSKQGDDFAARLYVFFDRKPAQMSFAERVTYKVGRARYGDQLPAAALCYVRDNRLPVGTIRDNAYTGFVKMIVATSGTARQGDWVTLQRDIAADYRRAFGTAPPRITGIAVAVDTDNTGESTVSFFGDIRFASKAGAP